MKKLLQKFDADDVLDTTPSEVIVDGPLTVTDADEVAELENEVASHIQEATEEEAVEADIEEASETLRVYRDIIEHEGHVSETVYKLLTSTSAGLCLDALSRRSNMKISSCESHHKVQHDQLLRSIDSALEALDKQKEKFFEKLVSVMTIVFGDARNLFTKYRENIAKTMQAISSADDRSFKDLMANLEATNTIDIKNLDVISKNIKETHNAVVKGHTRNDAGQEDDMNEADRLKHVFVTMKKMGVSVASVGIKDKASAMNYCKKLDQLLAESINMFKELGDQRTLIKVINSIAFGAIGSGYGLQIGAPLIALGGATSALFGLGVVAISTVYGAIRGWKMRCTMAIAVISDILKHAYGTIRALNSVLQL